MGDLWVGGGVVHAENTKFLWSPGGGELPAQKYVKKYSTYLSLQRDSTIDSTPSTYYSMGTFTLADFACVHPDLPLMPMQ